MKKQVDYSGLTRDEIEARLRAAEDVCLMYAWSPARSGDPRLTNREKAAYILWRRWDEMAGKDTDPARNKHLGDDVVTELAAQRDAERERVMARLSRVVVSVDDEA